MPIQMRLEDFATGLDRLLFGHGLEPPTVPGLLTAFNDEGRGVVIELVDMRPDPAMFGLLEDESEGVVELLVRAQPDELAQAHVDIRPELAFESRTGLRVEPVTGNHEIIVILEIRCCVELGLKAQLDPQFAGAFL